MKLMVVADKANLQLVIHVATARVVRSTLVGEILIQSFVTRRPKRLISDRVCDSDPLDLELTGHGIELIARWGTNRKTVRKQRCRGLATFTPLPSHAGR